MAEVSLQSTGNPIALRTKAPKRFQTARAFLKNGKAVVGLVIFLFFVLVGILAPVLATHDPKAFVGLPWQPPSGQWWFGTTDQGQDIYSQWVWGTRTSMAVGLASGLISTIIAVIIGVFAGYKGGLVDAILNTITNIVLVIPGFPLTLVIASYVPETGPMAITWVIGLTSWAGAARLKRSQALTFAGRDFIVAAKLAGASDLRIIFVEILPNMLSFVFNNFIFAALGGILAEAGLEFIGIGSPMTPSWGNMLNWADHGQALLNGGWWWIIPPGLSIALIGLAFVLMNFAMDEISNPRLRKPPKLSKLKSVGGPYLRMTVPAAEEGDQ
ncbi:MAG: ABC transporter permease [Alicyclobacillus shizuokensis]|nr:ABC transporter permease [Alicyclobacillus shizuokensis]